MIATVRLRFTRNGSRYLAMVGGVPLRGPKGNVRLFKSKEAAQEAADLDVFLRSEK